VSDAGPEAPPERTWSGWGTTRQRCDAGEEPLVPTAQPGPGQCEVIEYLPALLILSRYQFDSARGTARMRGTVLSDVPPPRHAPEGPASATWKGRAPVGYHRVDVYLDEPGAPRQTTTVSGVRWLRPTARMTFDGERLPVVSATMFAYKERTVFTAS
jgi:hypothetical protein